MQLKHVPVEIAGVPTDQTTLVVLGLTLIVGVLFVFTARREVATVAVAAGVLGAILMT